MIWCEILTLITNKHVLTPWKQKVRVEVIAQLKKHTIHNVNMIPSSNTIQHVLQILQSIFLSNKYYSKFFLTLLGDSLLKKTDSSLSIITSSSCDKFLNELEFQIHHYMKCYFKDSFKHKYHKQHYDNIRLLDTRECEKNAFIWSPTIKNYIFDIIFVACHYSKRYINSDN
jgi:hypothetical protein